MDKHLILIGIVLIGLTVCMPSDIKATREMEIGSVDLAEVADGTFQGSYTYAGSENVVKVTVSDHAIEKIEIIEAFSGTPYARKAQTIVDTVITYQSIDVDVISGATTSSKALLKCIENALREGIR